MNILSENLELKEIITLLFKKGGTHCLLEVIILAFCIIAVFFCINARDTQSIMGLFIKNI
jgi:hypothetical protein